MAEQVLEAPPQAKVDLKVVDCDVHPNLPTGDFGKDLRPYLSRGWAQKLDGQSAPDVPPSFFYAPPGGAVRTELLDANRMAATDPYVSAEELLDGYAVDRAVLMPQQIMPLGLLPDADVATTIAGAMNDYYLDRWIGADTRWRALITIIPQDIVWSLKEIERLHAAPGVVGIYVPLNSILLGQKPFYPVYEAAQELGLAMTTHVSLAGVYQTGMTMPGSYPANYLDFRTTLAYAQAAHVSSLVSNGIFETFPKIKFLFSEVGYAWLVDLMWRMDETWKGTRELTPFLVRPPSEYIRNHIRLSTQPWAVPENKAHIAQLLDMLHAEDTMVFSTDYPHWDADLPTKVIADIPESMRERVMAGNAAELFGDRLL